MVEQNTLTTPRHQLRAAQEQHGLVVREHAIASEHVSKILLEAQKHADQIATADSSNVSSDASEHAVRSLRLAEQSLRELQVRRADAMADIELSFDALLSTKRCLPTEEYQAHPPTYISGTNSDEQEEHDDFTGLGGLISMIEDKLPGTEHLSGVPVHRNVGGITLRRQVRTNFKDLNIKGAGRSLSAVMESAECTPERPEGSVKQLKSQAPAHSEAVAPAKSVATAVQGQGRGRSLKGNTYQRSSTRPPKPRTKKERESQPTKPERQSKAASKIPSTSAPASSSTAVPDAPTVSSRRKTSGAGAGVGTAKAPTRGRKTASMPQSHATVPKKKQSLIPKKTQKAKAVAKAPASAAIKKSSKASNKTKDKVAEKPTAQPSKPKPAQTSKTVQTKSRGRARRTEAQRLNDQGLDDDDDEQDQNRDELALNEEAGAEGQPAAKKSRTA